MPNLHVIPSGESWNIRQENGDVVGNEDTQAKAEQAAKSWLRSHGGGEVFTHRDEGEFSRIRKGDAVYFQARSSHQRGGERGAGGRRLPEGAERNDVYSVRNASSLSSERSNFSPETIVFVSRSTTR